MGKKGFFYPPLDLADFFVHFVDFFTERVCVQGQRPPVFNVSCKKLLKLYLAAQEF